MDAFLTNAGFVVVVVIGFLIYSKWRNKKTVASIPEEFKYVYLEAFDCIAVDLRHKKILLSQEATKSQKGGKKIYDFADIQKYERDSYIPDLRYSNTPPQYYLILHVNDPEHPTWQFRSPIIDPMDCAELLVSHALDGTLPDIDERRLINGYDNESTEAFKSLLSTGTGAQG